jgi:16S rRNA (cytosine967-C5)-methyltransferase
MPGLDARRGALERVRGGDSLDESLAKSRAFSLLEGPDRAFARAMASAALRRRGSIDHILGAYIDRPLPKRAVRVMDILRLAAVQLLVLKTPDHAAVSTAVALAGERRETGSYAKLVNAVARKIAKAGSGALENAPPRADTPGWMWRGWERGFGPARARVIAAAHRTPAPLDLTLKNPSAAADWRDRLDAELLATGTLRLAPVSDVTALEGFDDGAWWVQDAAAALPAKLFGDLNGKSVLDLCAAPGGKTLQLAAGGARVTALDISGPRLERLRANLERTKLKADIVEADMLKWAPTEKFDAVLLDAPCTATGTIRRHPDLPWLKTEDDVKALSALQGKMIDRALTFLKPGGTLVYCVCSLQPEEGERQAEAALSRRDHISRKPIAADEIGDLADAVTRAGDLRTLPSMLGESGGMDGFFAARFEKAGEG